MNEQEDDIIFVVWMSFMIFGLGGITRDISHWLWSGVFAALFLTYWALLFRRWHRKRYVRKTEEDKN